MKVSPSPNYPLVVGSKKHSLLQSQELHKQTALTEIFDHLSITWKCDGLCHIRGRELARPLLQEVLASCTNTHLEKLANDTREKTAISFVVQGNGIAHHAAIV